MNQQPNSDIIHSRQNTRVKSLVKLRQDSQFRKILRRFTIEGHKELTEALNNTLKIEEIFFCPHFFKNPHYHTLLQQAQQQKIPLQEVTQGIFQHIAYRENPDGLLAIAETWKSSFDDIKLSPKPLLLVVESVEKPGNLGGLIRTAEAAGVDAIIVCEPIIDIFNPNVVRTSRGLAFGMTTVTTHNQDALNYLTTHNITPIATSPSASTPYWNTNLARPTAILVGTERSGLSPFWLENPNVTPVKIPMHGQGDSLNASVSGTLVLYEALRQRVLIPKNSTA